MVEAFASCSVCRSLSLRKTGDDLGCKESRIDHDIFCFARMYIDTVNDKVGTCRVKILVGNLTFIITVYRVGIFGFKIIQVKQIRTCTDLFIRGKTNPDITVWSSFRDQLFQSGHDFSNARLVICAEKCCSVGGDQRATSERLKCRKIRYFKIGVTSF